MVEKFDGRRRNAADGDEVQPEMESNHRETGNSGVERLTATGSSDRKRCARIEITVDTKFAVVSCLSANDPEVYIPVNRTGA